MVHRSAAALLLIALTGPLVTAETNRSQSISKLFVEIDRADEMVVYSEGFKREFVIYRSGDRKDFEDLKSAITLKRHGGPFVCACMDGPEIVLLREKKEIAAIWNHEGTAIGSSVWQGDWQNSDPDRWLRWFDKRGIRNAREFFGQEQAEQRKSMNDERRWLDAMPPSLKPLWSNAVRQYNPPMSFPDLKPLSLALAKEYPNTYDRIRAVMAWFGSGAGPWSGFPGYEEIAEKLLREYPTTDLIKAVEGRHLTEQELEGAARVLGSWQPVPDPTPIPIDLRRTLLEHCLKSSDEDKVQRARKAFSLGV
jgi:hypothetical protein